MINFLKLPIATLLVFALTILNTGCQFGSSSTVVPHPNEINTFDGAVYDSLTIAHSALLSLGPQIKTSFPTYTAEYNTAVQAYDVAYTTYSAYRSSPTADTTNLTAQILNITVAVAALETAIQKDMGVSPAVVASIRAKVIKIKKSKINSLDSTQFSIADLLTELEIAAQVAETIPVAAPYAALASVVIQATAAAIAAFTAASGTAINLATISPVPVLSITPDVYKNYIQKHAFKKRDVPAGDMPVTPYHGMTPVIPPPVI